MDFESEAIGFYSRKKKNVKGDTHESRLPCSVQEFPQNRPFTCRHMAIPVFSYDKFFLYKKRGSLNSQNRITARTQNAQYLASKRPLVQ
jgi:hypothetical protein